MSNSVADSINNCRIDEYNPYPSFQCGQKEAITQILDLYDDGANVIELNAPTASGKSLDLYVLGLILSKEYKLDKTIYSTPLVALADQLGSNEKFDKMPVLKGKKNYPCAKFYEIMADDCPFKNWFEAIKFCKGGNELSRGSPCCECEYQLARAAFAQSPFGATTFARYIVDPACHGACKALLIDESASLETALINFSTLKLPNDTDIKNLRNSVLAYSQELAEESADLEEEINSLQEDLKTAPKGHRQSIVETIAQRTKQKNKCDREQRKCAKVVYHIDHNHPYIVDREMCFRLLEGKSEFKRLIEKLDLAVLASGTPTSSIYAEDFKTVLIQHPIPLSQRLIYYAPVGSMNYNDRNTTAPKLAAAIEILHAKYHKKTMVHCGAYGIAKLIYGYLSETAQAITILQEDPEERELYKSMFEGCEDEQIFFSIKFTEGLDLKGPEYPMNIIAKVPFENTKDEFVAHRNQHDNWMRYNKFAAVEVMQAAGRCTRAADDFSETWILDASWRGLLNRNRKMFEPWFLAALREGRI
jgi:Rad3-related DNA helicase